MTLTHGSLFAGIGGFDLAARWVGWQSLWYSEIEPYACKVMAKNFPEAVNLGDITKIAHPPGVDVLSGGFPCQDISLAGKGAGLSGTRSGLWVHYKRIIGEIRPRWVVAENVAALRTRGLDQVLSDLASLGYDAEWHCIPASAVGAPHRRDRIWILARPAGLFPDPVCTDMADAASDGRGEERSVSGGRGQGGGAQGTDRGGSPFGGDVGDAIGPRLEGHAGNGGNAGREAEAGSASAAGLRGGADAPGWWASEPDVGRVAHGVPARVDRLRCLGNAIVPQVALYLFRQIIKAEAAADAEFARLLA